MNRYKVAMIVVITLTAIIIGIVGLEVIRWVNQ